MNFSTAQLLRADLWRRGRVFFSFAMIFPCVVGIVFGREETVPTFAFYIGVVPWMFGPLVIWNRSDSALLALPLTRKSIGRAIWWSTCGVSALSLLAALVIGGIVGYATGRVIRPTTTYLACGLFVIAISGHAIGQVLAQIAQISKDTPAASHPSRVLPMAGSLMMPFLIFVAVTSNGSIVSGVIAAVTGSAVALFSYRHAEVLVLSLPETRSRTARIARPEDHSTTSAGKTSQRIYSHWPQWLAALFSIAAITMMFRAEIVSGKDDPSNLPVAVMIGILVSFSGMVGGSRKIISVHALRALPISVTELAWRILITAATPAAILMACVFAYNALQPLTSLVNLLKLSIYVVAFQTLWPPMQLNEIAGSGIKRVFLLLGIFVSLLIGGMLILAGSLTVVLLSPVIVAVSYRWTYKTIRTNSYARQSQNVAIPIQ